MVCYTITFQLRRRQIFPFLVFESPEKHANVETPGWLYFSKKPLFIGKPPCEFHRAEIVPSLDSISPNPLGRICSLSKHFEDND